MWIGNDRDVEQSNFYLYRLFYPQKKCLVFLQNLACVNNYCSKCVSLLKDFLIKYWNKKVFVRDEENLQGNMNHWGKNVQMKLDIGWWEFWSYETKVIFTLCASWVCKKTTSTSSTTSRLSSTFLNTNKVWDFQDTRGTGS